MYFPGIVRSVTNSLPPQCLISRRAEFVAMRTQKASMALALGADPL